MELENIVITKNIGKIGFGVMSPNMIKKIATINVTSPELYDADGYPVEKGLMDLGMGVIDPGLRCKICGGRLRTCPGHFGYLQLARPVVNILYAARVHDVLRSFCGSCGRALLPQQKLDQWKELIAQAKKENNLDSIQELIKTVTAQLRKVRKCPHCKLKALDVKIEKPTTFIEGDRRLWPVQIRERLEKIPDEDLEVLGFDPSIARPEWMVLTMLLVPPIIMRPSITLMTGERSEDDLTHKLSDIVRVNQRLQENINAGAPEIIIEDLWDLLQYHITTYFNNSIAGVPPARHKTNRPLKTLAQRLKGKEGRFRYNLAGKRVNFSARSVISPDPHMDINEVGVPKYVASELTIPERVTEWNMKWLKNFISNVDSYPGANYVISEEGKRKKVTEETKEQILEELAPGWLVERHLLDGDVILFNRQPSLHRMSMMAHIVKIMPGKTFRIHPAVAKPYNADFDGDEMNLHLPQTEEARSEAKNLLLLDKQIITPRYGLSIIGEVEDATVGLYKLANGDNYYTRAEACQLLIKAGIMDPLPKPEKKEKGIEMFNGRQLFSLALPKDVNFNRIGVKIENGELTQFSNKEKAIDKLLGPEGGLLIHYLYGNYGSDKTKTIINKLNQLGMAVIVNDPYTISFSDLDLSTRAKNRIKDSLVEGEKDVAKILKKYDQGNIIPIPGKSEAETREALILNVLNNLRKPVGEIVEKEAKAESNLVLMSNCGLAGLLNLALMAGFAGQMALRGERIHKGFTDRTLSHFKRGDLGPAARGFVSRGYIDGMKPLELFFNAVVGRDNMMDTAMRTPKSGYMQRRLINALQDLRVNYDGTVRDSGQKIIQFIYGGDNIDVAKSDHGTIDVD